MNNLNELTTRFDYIGVEDITDFLTRLTGADDNEKNEISDGLYYLQTCAQNPYNAEYFRTLYKTLIVATGKLLEKGDFNND